MKNYRRARFWGFSMYPSLRPGDMLIMDIIMGKDCLPGDIVLMPGQGKLIAHRIIEVDRRQEGVTLITKGDNLPYFDPPFPLSPDGIGRVILIVRNGSHFIRPRFRRTFVHLSRNNLTVGIIRGKVGRVLRGFYRRLRP
jgi:signal peptidase I